MRCAACFVTILLGALLAGCAGAPVHDTRTVEQIAADATITSNINVRMMSDTRIDSFAIGVDTLDGIVTLTGTVPDAKMAAAAVKVAGSVAGVRKVVSELRVEAH